MAEDVPPVEEPPQGKLAAVCFCGPMVHPWTQSLRNVLCGCANDGVTDLLLLLSSNGGSIADGFAIYNLLRSMPYNVHTHNLGIVQSIANVVYVAGSQRTAAPESSFMFHGFSWNFAQETLDEAQIAERTGHIVTGRSEFVRIFEERTKWNADTFEDKKLFDRAKVIMPKEAMEAGIVHVIQHTMVPAGIPIVNIAIAG